MSRPLLNLILDDGRIAFFETAGGHRKIKLAAIRAYIEERDSIATQPAAVRAERKPDGDIIRCRAWTRCRDGEPSRHQLDPVVPGVPALTGNVESEEWRHRGGLDLVAVAGVAG